MIVWLFLFDTANKLYQRKKNIFGLTRAIVVVVVFSVLTTVSFALAPRDKKIVQFWLCFIQFVDGNEDKDFTLPTSIPYFVPISLGDCKTKIVRYFHLKRDA